MNLTPLSSNDEFKTLASLKTALILHGISTSTDVGITSDERYMVLSKRLVDFINDTAKENENENENGTNNDRHANAKTNTKTTSKKIKQRPLNKRVKPTWSIIELRSKLDSLNIDTATPGKRGDLRHRELLERLSRVFDGDDCGDDDFGDSDGDGGDHEEEEDGGDVKGKNGYIERLYIPQPQRTQPLIQTQTHKQNNKKDQDNVQTNTKNALSDDDFTFDVDDSLSFTQTQTRLKANHKQSTGTNSKAKSGDWALTASVNDDYDIASVYSKSKAKANYDDEFDDDGDEGGNDKNDNFVLDKSNKYGGFENLRKGFQDRTRKSSLTDKSNSNSKSNNVDGDDDNENGNDVDKASDYIDLISSTFNLPPSSSSSPSTESVKQQQPQTILRPSSHTNPNVASTINNNNNNTTNTTPTKTLPNNIYKNNKTTTTTTNTSPTPPIPTPSKIRFAEPVEPYIPPNLRLPQKSGERLTLHEHASNEKLRREQMQGFDYVDGIVDVDRDRDRDRSESFESVGGNNGGGGFDMFGSNSSMNSMSSISSNGAANNNHNHNNTFYESPEKQAERKVKMNLLKAKLGGAKPPNSPKPQKDFKDDYGLPSPLPSPSKAVRGTPRDLRFDGVDVDDEREGGDGSSNVNLNLPPPSPTKNHQKQDSSASSISVDTATASTKSKIITLTQKITTLKATRSTSLKALLNPHNPICPPSLRTLYKKSSQLTVEITRISQISTRDPSALVSCVLVEGGTSRMNAVDMVGVLDGMLVDVTRDLNAEREGVREGEMESLVYGGGVVEGFEREVEGLKNNNNGNDYNDDDSGNGKGKGKVGDGVSIPIDYDDAKHITTSNDDRAPYLPVIPPPFRTPFSSHNVSSESESSTTNIIVAFPPLATTPTTPSFPPTKKTKTKKPPPIHNPSNTLSHKHKQNQQPYPSSQSQSQSTKKLLTPSEVLAHRALSLQATDFEQAKELYAQALHLSLDDDDDDKGGGGGGLRVICNYACFLWMLCREYDDAEVLFKRGCVLVEKIRTRDSGNINVYGSESESERMSGESKSEKSQSQSQKNLHIGASILTNYAIFLSSIRGYKTESLKRHKQAISLDSTHAGAVGNYGKFIMDCVIDNNHNGDAGSDGGDSKSQSQLEEAEKILEKALNLDPDNPRNLNIYARLLTKLKPPKSKQADLTYTHALSVSPFDISLLCNYANFLKTVKGDLEKAKGMYVRALGVDGEDFEVKRNYGIFLRDCGRGGRVVREVDIDSDGKGNGKDEDEDGKVEGKVEENEVEAKVEKKEEKTEVPPEKVIEVEEEEVKEEKEEESSEDESESESDPSSPSNPPPKTPKKPRDNFQTPPVPAHLLTHRRLLTNTEVPSEVLDDGWSRYCDPATRYDYYYNEVSGESVYERPGCFKTMRKPFDLDLADLAISSQASYGKPEVGVLNGKRSKHEKGVEVMEGGWVRYCDEETRFDYYYNAQTGESQYERPDEYSTSKNAFLTARVLSSSSSASASASILNSLRSLTQPPSETLLESWLKYIDPTTGTAYYYNSVTDMSTYNRPGDFVTSLNPFGAVQSQSLSQSQSLRGDGEGLTHQDQGRSSSSKTRGRGTPVEVIANTDWTKYLDEDTGSSYYYHEGKDESTYDRPNGFSTSANPFQSVSVNNIPISGDGKMKMMRENADILSSRRKANVKADEVLNDVWSKYLDGESGHYYYYNSNSEESTYDRPSSFSTNSNPFNHGNGNDNEISAGIGISGEGKRDVNVDILSSRRGAEACPEEFLNGGWVKYIDEETSYEYYYHDKTQESTYDRPADFSTKRDAFSGQR